MNKLKLTLKNYQKQKTTFSVKDIEIGKDFFVIAGPCSVESEGQIIKIAQSIKESGANVLRGGAYKPRTSPYSFQGLGKEGIKYLCEARKATGLPFVTEVMDTRDVDFISQHADILQVGARNIQNYSLLKELGRIDKPILLKRGFSTTIEEFLCCAEYIMDAGNSKIIMCERGIRSGTSGEIVFDINIIPKLKAITHLPVIADISHATGHRNLVPPISLAAIMAGVDALMIEVHSDCKNALSDKEQQLDLMEFNNLNATIKKTLKLRTELNYNKQ